MTPGPYPDGTDPTPRVAVLDALDRLDDAYGDDGVPEVHLFEEAGKSGHPLDALEQVYDDLKRKGELYVVGDRVKRT